MNYNLLITPFILFIFIFIKNNSRKLYIFIYNIYIIYIIYIYEYIFDI